MTAEQQSVHEGRMQPHEGATGPITGTGGMRRGGPTRATLRAGGTRIKKGKCYRVEPRGAHRGVRFTHGRCAPSTVLLLLKVVLRHAPLRRR